MDRLSADCPVVDCSADCSPDCGRRLRDSPPTIVAYCSCSIDYRRLDWRPLSVLAAAIVDTWPAPGSNVSPHRPAAVEQTDRYPNTRSLFPSTLRQNTVVSPVGCLCVHRSKVDLCSGTAQIRMAGAHDRRKCTRTEYRMRTRQLTDHICLWMGRSGGLEIFFYLVQNQTAIKSNAYLRRSLSSCELAFQQWSPRSWRSSYRSRGH